MYKLLFLKILLIFFIFLITVTLSAQEGWQTGVRLNTPRTGASAVTFNGKIYVLGGRTTGETVLHTVEVFDPDSNRWDSSIPPLIKARHSAAAIVFNDSIYVLGGVSDEKKPVIPK